MKINLYGPVCNTSYSIVARSLNKALLNLGVDVNFVPIGQIDPKFGFTPNQPDPLIPSVKVWHQTDMSMEGSVKIAFPIFELDTFSPEEIKEFARPDFIFCPSQWGKSIIDSNTNRGPDTYIVPLGFDPTVFQERRNGNGGVDKPYVFLNVGKWEYRKGHDVLLKAFETLHLYSKHNFQLWMVALNPFSKDDELRWETMYKNSPASSRIKIFKDLSDKELLDVYQKSDCGVFPSRAEGWNLPALELLACHKHIIATNYSAHTEFLNKDNSDLIDCPDREIAYDGFWFYGQGNWAKLDETFIRKLSASMKRAYETRPIGKGSNLTWENSAKTILKHIETLGI